LLLDQPVERRSRTIGAVGRQPFRLQAKTLRGPFDHGFSRADFGLPNGARCFDIEYNRRLQIDEIIVGIGKESMALECSRPLRSGIGARDELRFDLAGRAPCGLSSVSRYSCTERRVAPSADQSRACEPGIERCLLASAAIRVASTAKPSPPTRPSSMQRLTTVSKTWRKASLSRKRP
jgi:hypothetical protein